MSIKYWSSVFLSKGYLKHLKQMLFKKETLEAFFFIPGLAWLCIEIAVFISPSWLGTFQSKNLWTYIIIGSFLWVLWTRKPRTSICERLNGSDIKIEIRIADILNLPTAYIIPTNTTFDTAINENLISKNSLQGKFTNKFYNNSTHLDTDLTKSLVSEPIIESRESRVEGKKDLYAIGTVASVTPRNKNAYLLAISELNEHGTAQSNFENIRIALASLWNFISLKAGRYEEELAIPILGTGNSRVPTTRERIIKEIIDSFITTCCEKRFISKLIIVISPHDYHKYGLNIDELGEFLRYKCRYTEIKSNIPVGEIQ